MLKLVRKLSGKRRWLRQIIWDALQGEIRGNLYNSYPSHFHRELISKIYEFDLQAGISNAIFRYSQIRSSGNERPIPPDYFDIVAICYLVNYFGAKSILEFGSGCSTAGILQVTKFSGLNSRFVSIESVEFWAEINNGALSQLSVGGGVIRYSPVVIENVGGVDSYVHARVPCEDYDFIYLDGPELKQAQSALDIIKYNLVHDQLVVVIDGRDANVDILVRQMRGHSGGWNKYAIKYPSNDTIIVNERNRRFLDFVEDFQPALTIS